MLHSHFTLGIVKGGCTVVWWLAHSVWSLHVLPVYAWVLSRYSGFLPPSKNMHVRLIGDSELSLGVSVSVHGCLSHLTLSGPVMYWRPVQDVPCLSPNDSWDRLQYQAIWHMVLNASFASTYEEEQKFHILLHLPVKRKLFMLLPTCICDPDSLHLNTGAANQTHQYLWIKFSLDNLAINQHSNC